MKIKITPFVLLILLSYISSTMFAQEPEQEEAPKNVVKLNLGALALTNISLQYERAFHKNFSYALQGGFLLSRGLPKQLNVDGGDFTNLTVSGFNCAPELRIYPGKKVKRQAPRGFYLAPYGRFSHYTTSAYFMFADSNTVPVQQVPVDFKATFTGFGAGLLIGTQFIISEKVSIDWWILGGHFGVAKLSGVMDSQIVYDNQYNFYEQLESVEIPYGTKTFEVKGSRASVNLAGIPFGGIRSGLCIGFAF